MVKLKRYWKLLISLLAILLALGVYLGIEHYKEQQLKNYYGKFLSYRPPKRIKRAEFLDGQSVAIDWENTDKKADRYIPKIFDFDGLTDSTSCYIIREQRRLRGETGSVNSSFTRNKLQKGEYWFVNIYKKTGQKLGQPTKIDIPKVVRKYKSSYYPTGVDILKQDGKSFLTIFIDKISTAGGSDYGDNSRIYMDLETQEILDEREIKRAEKRISPFIGVELYKKVEKQGLYFSDNDISLTKEGIKQSRHWRIAKKYPKVYKILKNGGNLYLMQDETDMDYTAKILQLFAPKGKDIFDGVAIPSEYSTDGQAHTVKSYEEFKKYYKTEGME